MLEPTVLLLLLVVFAVPAASIGLAWFHLHVPSAGDQQSHELRLMLLITTCCFIWMFATFFVFRLPGVELRLRHVVGTVVIFAFLAVWAGFRGSQLRGKLLLACL